MLQENQVYQRHVERERFRRSVAKAWFMDRWGRITGEATDEQIAAGIEKMRKLAMETAQPFDKMREGMDALTSSGKSFQESLAMMPAIARTAQASGAGMADTANSSVALLNHLSIKAEELQAAHHQCRPVGALRPDGGNRRASRARCGFPADVCNDQRSPARAGD